MVGMLAGIIMVQVFYLVLHNYVYDPEEGKGKEAEVADEGIHPVLQPSSAPKYSLPFRYICDMLCSSSLADGDTREEAGTPLKAPRKKQSAWLMWFSPKSSQLLGEVCVAAMILEHQKKAIRFGDYVESNQCNSGSVESSSGGSSLRGAAAPTAAATITSKRGIVGCSRRDKEIQKPVATFALLGIEYCGRVFLIPFILFYTNMLMLDESMAQLALIFNVSCELCASHIHF
jgi:hypothetical protein